MPGLKALSDIVKGPQQSRAVSAHAASVGASDAASLSLRQLALGMAGAWELVSAQLARLYRS